MEYPNSASVTFRDKQTNGTATNFDERRSHDCFPRRFESNAAIGRRRGCWPSSCLMGSTSERLMHRSPSAVAEGVAGRSPMFQSRLIRTMRTTTLSTTSATGSTTRPRSIAATRRAWHDITANSRAVSRAPQNHNTAWSAPTQSSARRTANGSRTASVAASRASCLSRSQPCRPNRCGRAEAPMRRSFRSVGAKREGRVGCIARRLDRPSSPQKGLLGGIDAGG